MKKEIFKAYDIRGTFPEELNKEIAMDIGKAFAKFINGKSVVVGYDMRETSKDVHEGFVKGVIDSGLDVYDIGLSSTPMLYWSVKELGADAGTIITASHNPMNYAGMKFVDKEARPIFEPTGIYEIRDMAINKDFLHSEKPGKIITKKEIFDEYVRFQKNNTPELKKFKVVFDTMCGSIGPLVEKVFEESPMNIFFVSTKPDPNLSGYSTPNPMLDINHQKIKAAINENDADLGFIWDGDGDRVLMVDKKGELVSPNLMISLISSEVLKRRRGSIVCDIRTSKFVENKIIKEGGSFIKVKAGNPFVKKEMRDSDADFGAETSGHFMFKSSYYSEDSVLAVINILSALSKFNESPQEVFDRFENETFINPEFNLKITDPQILEKVAAEYSDATIEKLDGISAIYPDFWFNIRKSNTEPLIRVSLIEAESEEILNREKEKLLNFLLENGCELSDH